jgi:exosortase family protein XrtM
MPSPQPPRAGASVPGGSGIALVLRFVLIFLALQALYAAIPDAVLERDIVHHGLARPAAWLIGAYGHGDATAVTNEIHGPAAVLAIIRGCDGSSGMFLLVAAIAAFHAPWRHRLGGAALGLLLLHALNIARVAGLYALLAADVNLFHAVHEFVAPSVTVLGICLYYVAWCAWLPNHAPTRGG